MTDTRDLAARALITKCVSDVATGAIKARRAELAAALANGDRIQVAAPDDPELDLGMVYRTKTQGSAAITDRTALTAWMAAEYPDHVERVPTITDTDAAIAVLSRHAPHLVTVSAVIAPWAETEVLTCTTRAKEPCGPGGELDIPGVTYRPPGPGAVTVKLSDDGPALIEQLWRQGRIDLASGEVRALPSGNHMTRADHLRTANRLLSDASFRAGGPGRRPVRRDGSEFSPGEHEALLTEYRRHQKLAQGDGMLPETEETS